VRIGGNANTAVRYVASDPDGVLTAPKGTLAVDTTTGIWWRNMAGGSDWWPEVIPMRYGSRIATDFVGSLNPPPYSVTAVSGTGAIASAAPTAGRQGVISLSVSAVADAAAPRADSATSVLLGSGKVYFEAAAAISTSEDGVNRFSTRAGLGDVTAGDFVDGVYFESSLAGNGSVNWFRCTASNSVRTKTDTSVAATGGGTYQRLRWRANAAGSQVDYWVDDVSVGSNTTNIPTAAGRDCGPILQAIKTLGAAARTVLVDYADWAFLLTTAR
jgi:hypothetical protein